MQDLLSRPPIVVFVFLALSFGLYRLGGKIGARSEDTPGKHQPYACGEELSPPKAQLAYHSFFRLALLFGILHLATLVLSTLPQETTAHRMAFVYLVGIGISVFVLTGENT